MFQLFPENEYKECDFQTRDMLNIYWVCWLQSKLLTIMHAADVLVKHFQLE